MKRASVAETLAGAVPLAGLAVIDVGCGDGGLVRYMARQGAHVTGIDPSPRQLELARAASPVADERYLHGVAEDLPVEAASADLVVFCNSLHHVPVATQPAALLEAARALKAGGTLYVSEPLPEGAYFEVTRLIDDETEVRGRAYEALRAIDAGRLTPSAEFVHNAIVRHADFATYRDRATAIDPTRAAIIAAKAEQLEAAFLAAARRGERGWEFDQPTRVNIFRRN